MSEFPDASAPRADGDGNADGRAYPDAPEDRWSFGGAAALETTAGVLTPGVLVIGPGHAALAARLLPADEAAGTRRPLAPARARVPELRVKDALDNMAAHRTPGFDDVIVTDDRGARYTLRVVLMSTPPWNPGQVREPTWLSLSLDPVPARECGWFELRTQDGTATRLLPSARPAVRVGPLAPVSGSLAERLPLGQSGMPDAVQRADGPRHHLDISAALPPLDDTAVQLDSLVSEPESWHVYLRARPGWWIHSEDRHRKWAAVSVDVEDDLGGRYRSMFGGSTGHDDYEEVTLRFLPRLDPLAHTLKLTFSGKREQITVELRLIITARSEPE
jgi:hypothetical protein